ncbi:MAG: antitoxin VapB family protein [Candidatus Parvarchaeota archaeon]|nr:antitoxin VapB family protein [Candidatus Parvarchaeota archaeon]MCL5420170.1 antitoxin VapB family protein [Candidatus Parvarchaeota archaeon]
MKTVMLNDEVYNNLSKIKGTRSFSELLKELLQSSEEYKTRLLESIKGTLTEEESKEAEKVVKKIREHTKVRDL